VKRRPRKYLPGDRSKLRYWLIVSGFVLADVSAGAFTLGTAVLLLGMALHLWSKGSLNQNHILAETGPYRWVRHPFYLANALIDLGLCVIINRTEVLLVYLPLWLAGYWKSVQQEERVLETLFGERYRQYKRKVPSLLPWRIPEHTEGPPAFSWRNRNIANGSEIPRLLRLAGYPLALFSASELREMGLGFFSDLSAGVVALWFFLLLSCASFVLKRKLKKHPLAMPPWMTTGAARNAFVVFLLTAAFFFHFAESEMDYGDFVVGALLCIGLFLAVFLARRLIGSVAELATLMEGLILIVVCFLAELPWLALLPMSYYSALWVDGVGATASRLPHIWIPEFRMPWVRLELILIAGVVLVLWKERFDAVKAFYLTFGGF
jgi:protein-S-isoprenylcysteine O-methyltransferase Ste14